MSENNISLEAKDQPFEATTYGGLLRIARENKELSIDQVSSQLGIFLPAPISAAMLVY